MSVHVTGPIYRLNLKGEAKAILLVFGDHANPDGSNSWPSLAIVAREAGFSLKTANRYAAAFRHDKVLVVEDNAGSGRRSVTYRIDMQRAKAIYGVLDDAAPDVPFSVPGPQPKAKEKGHCDPVPDEKKRVTVSNKRVTVSKEKGHSDPQTILEPSEPTRAPAREAAAETPAPADPAGGSADPGSDPGDGQLTTRAHWQARSAELERHFGDDWGAWLRDRIVLQDDGSAMVLGAPTDFIAKWCGRFVPDLERILGRKVSIVVFVPSVEALRKRREKAKQAETAAAGNPRAGHQ